MTQLGTGLSERDLAIVRDVGELRLVTAEQLRRLHFTGPAATSTNHRIARRCLQRLAAAGYLWRAQRRVGGLYGGSTSAVYGLGTRGTRLLGRVGRGRRDEPSLAFLEHQLAVAETYVVLHEAHARGELHDLDVRTEPDCWRPLDNGSGGWLKPDLYVLLSTAEEDVLSFIEVDNDTEHRTAIQRKAALYRTHWQSGQEQREQGVFPLIVWLAKHERRRDQLTDWLRASEPPELHQVADPASLINLLTKGGTHV